MSVLISLSATKATAQSVTDLFPQILRDAAKDTKIGGGLQSLSIFSVTPGVSAAIFNPDHDTPGTDLRIETLKLPLSYDFTPIISGIQPYSELTLSYVHVDEEDSFNLQPGQQTTLDSDIDAYSALAGLGATIPVVRYIHMRPILLAGYSRTNVDTKFKGPFAEELKDASSGLINDAKINTILLGGAFQAKFDRRLNNAIHLGSGLITSS
jgi:hypothetical protein